MQSTLLGIAIAIIVALVTALVAPLFIDFGRYRTQFEAQANRLTGLDVHIAGPIEARFLPTPRLTMQTVSIGRPGEPGTVEARKFSMELSLNSLVRGDWRVSAVRLDGAEFNIGFDSAGRPNLLTPANGRLPAALSIDEFDIAGSRVVLTDAASGRRLVLDNFEFGGEVRALTGPIRGEGSFRFGGERYPYRVSASRNRTDGATQVRLAIAPRDHGLTADADGSISLERGRPHFEGNVQLMRAVERAGNTGSGPFNDRWRLSTRVTGDTTAAKLDEIEIEYGPTERAIKLHGDAKLSLGAKPRLEGVLAGSQIDLDRVLALANQTRRPHAATTVLANILGDATAPIAVQLGINVEALTFAGATLQRVSGELRNEGDGWAIRSLEFRGPGLTQVQIGGRLSPAPTGVAFAGPVKIDSQNPRALLAWLMDRGDEAVTGPLHAEGEIKLGGGTMEVDRLSAEIGRVGAKGRLAYAWASGAHPARLDAMLDAPEFDLDRVRALARGLFGDTQFEWPREGTLALNFGKATLAGMEAERVGISTQFAAQTLDIDRLAIGNIGGISVVANGRIDTRTFAPRGTLAIDFEARALDGLVALVEKVAPTAADSLRREASQLVPAKLSLSFAMKTGADAAPGAVPQPTVKIDGIAGAVGVSIVAVADTSGGAVTLADLVDTGSANVDISGSLTVPEGRTLVDLSGLDRLLNVDNRAGRFTFKAAGPIDGQMTLDAELEAGGIDIAANGPIHLSGSRGPTADLALSVVAANVKTLRPEEALALALSGRLALSDAAATMTDLSAKVAGSEVKGRLAFDLARGMTVDGDLSVNALNLPAVISAGLGAPIKLAQAGWSTETFEIRQSRALVGEVRVNAGTATLLPGLASGNIRGKVMFGPSDVAFDDLEGTLAGGRISGGLAFRRRGDAVDAQGRIRVEDADIATLIPGDGRPKLEGRVSLDAEISGTGHSPAAVLASLRGVGTFVLQNGRIAQLDPGVFDAVARSVDTGLPIEAAKIRERVEQTLAVGGLPVARAEGPIAVNAGRVRLNTTTMLATGADPEFTASIDLQRSTADARLTLRGIGGANGQSSNRPQIGIAFNGPFDSLKRSLDVAALTSWLALRASEQQAVRLEALKAVRNDPPASPAATPKADTATPAVPAARPASSPPAARPEIATSPAKPLANPSPPPAAIAPQVAAIPAKPAEPTPEAKNPPEDPAVAALDRAIAANPTDATALYRRGQLLAGRNNFSKAIADFDAVIRLEPKNAEAFNNRCWARAILGDAEMALKDCNEALQIRPRFVDALDSRGFVNLKLGQVKKAIEDYDAALKGNPKQASSLYGRGIARVRSGNTTEGMSDIAAAKAIQSNIAEEFAGYGIR